MTDTDRPHLLTGARLGRTGVVAAIFAGLGLLPLGGAWVLFFLTDAVFDLLQASALNPLHEIASWFLVGILAGAGLGTLLTLLAG